MLCFYYESSLMKNLDVYFLFPMISDKKINFSIVWEKFMVNENLYQYGVTLKEETSSQIWENEIFSRFSHEK